MTLVTFINNMLLPFLFGLALLFFVWNSVRFFVIGGNNQEAQESAKRLALYGVGGLVLLVSLWGIVNMLVYGLGWYSEDSVVPDYMFSSPDQSSYPSTPPAGEYAEPFRGPR